MKSFRRSRKNIPEQKIIGIFCEGESELQYFNMLKRKYHSANVGAHRIKIRQFHGKKGIDLIRTAIAQRKAIKDIDETYVAFDCDDMSNQDIQNSVNLAEKKNIHIIFSRTNFEIWILMHFEQVNKVYTKDQLNTKLSDAKHFNLKNTSYGHFKGNEYSPMLEDKVKIAVENAETLYLRNNNIVQDEPFTNVQNSLIPIFGMNE